MEVKEFLLQMPCDGLKFCVREIWPDGGTKVAGSHTLGMKNIPTKFHGDLASNCQEILLWTELLDKQTNQLGPAISWASKTKSFDI